MAKQLDRIDQEMIRQLRGNARMPLVALARAVGLSRSATQERLARLERSGAIAGYTLRSAAPPAGGIEAWFLVSVSGGPSCTELAGQIRLLHDFAVMHSLAGKPDLAALARVGNQAELFRLRESIASLPGVTEVTSSVVLADLMNL